MSLEMPRQQKQSNIIEESSKSSSSDNTGEHNIYSKPYINSKRLVRLRNPYRFSVPHAVNNKVKENPGALSPEVKPLSPIMNEKEKQFKGRSTRKILLKSITMSNIDSLVENYVSKDPFNSPKERINIIKPASPKTKKP